MKKKTKSIKEIDMEIIAQERKLERERILKLARYYLIDGESHGLSHFIDELKEEENG